MAEEEAKEENSAQDESPKKGGSLVLIIVIVVLVLIILIGAVAGILFMGSDESSPQQQQQMQGNYQQQNNQQQQQQQQNMPQRTSALPQSNFAEVGPMFPLDSFTINLLSDSGRRYLKVEMNLELGNEELAAELESKTAVIRDIVIRLLSSKSLDEISTPKGKDKLKEQIVTQLNMRLKDGHINNVYFTEFVVQ